MRPSRAAAALRGPLTRPAARPLAQGWALTLALTLALLLNLIPQTAAAQTLRTLREAQVELRPDGLPAQTLRVKLGHRWDENFPGRGGSAVYRVALPPAPGDEPQALLFTRLGNQAEARINGSVVARWGQAGDQRFDAAKTSWMVTVPAALLAAEGNVLEVTVHCQPLRWGGLSQVQFGALAEVEAVLQWQQLGRQKLPVAMAAGYLIVGLTALGLWWRQRLPLYGWFAAAALLGVVRHLDRVWYDVPLPWPALGALVAMAYVAHLALMGRVVLEIVGVSGRRLHRALLATLATVCALAAAAFLLNQPALWRTALALLLPYGALVGALVARTAWRRRQRTLGVLLLGAVALLALGIAADLLGLRLDRSPAGAFSVLPVAVFVIVIVVAVLVVRRYNATAEAYRTLSAELAQRVQQREAELRQAFEALRQGQREQATIEERQRLMREIHDGVGAHLVLLLNMAEPGRAELPAIQQQARLALDELRMAVDAMQPVHGDLATVLATMRYRLGPRLEAAGLQMHWDVGQLPPLATLTPQAVLHVHRILLEALGNVLRHAGARTVAVQAQAVQTPVPAIVVTLQDDGIGIQPVPAGSTTGHGLANMQTRAQAIGAVLTLQRVQPQGTRLVLVWPLPGGAA